MVRSGRLRHRVQLQSRDTSTVDAAGQVTGGWTTYDTRYGEVINTGGAEKVRGQQVSATASHVVRMRYPQGTLPTTEHRVLFNGRCLNIENVKQMDTREHEIWIACRAEAYQFVGPSWDVGFDGGFGNG